MFEVKKEEVRGTEEVDYPVIKVWRHRFLKINDSSYVVSGYGHAKCDTGDKFDRKFGTELAMVRAYIDMLKDYEKKLISLTKQPEWRKEKKVEAPTPKDFKKATHKYWTGTKDINKITTMYFFNAVDATQNISNISMLSDSEKELI
ncbi:MAG: hypothetical protein ACYCXQ_00870 [Candidatus Humimicrobiaceae bacterium]